MVVPEGLETVDSVYVWPDELVMLEYDEDEKVEKLDEDWLCWFDMMQMFGYRPEIGLDRFQESCSVVSKL